MVALCWVDSRRPGRSTPPPLPHPSHRVAGDESRPVATKLPLRSLRRWSCACGRHWRSLWVLSPPWMVQMLPVLLSSQKRAGSASAPTKRLLPLVAAVRELPRRLRTAADQSLMLRRDTDKEDSQPKGTQDNRGALAARKRHYGKKKRQPQPLLLDRVLTHAGFRKATAIEEERPTRPWWMEE